MLRSAVRKFQWEARKVFVSDNGKGSGFFRAPSVSGMRSGFFLFYSAIRNPNVPLRISGAIGCRLLTLQAVFLEL